MRLLNFCLVVVLVLATAYVYEIKFEATVRLARVAEMTREVRRVQETIATLRAEWGRLENPGRLEGLSRRHWQLRSPELWQYDQLDHLPDRPLDIIAPPANEAIANSGNNDLELPTGSIKTPGVR
jgi:cell division protein FtsL